MWLGARPELRKLLHMLRLFASHEGTHALGIVIAVGYTAQWSARKANRDAHIDAFVKRITHDNAPPQKRGEDEGTVVEDGPGKETPETKTMVSEKQLHYATALAARSIKRASASLGRNLHSLTTITYQRLLSSGDAYHKSNALRQSRSASALQKLLKKSSSNDSLCSDCLSRASSHSSLVGLAEEEEEQSNVHHKQACNDAECTVCQRERMTWRSFLRRAACVVSASIVSYLIWLRYIASKETALQHLSAFFRVFQKMFSYKVKGAQRLPKSGPAVGVIYHGWLPLDMYFLQEYIINNVRRDCMVMVANFVFQIPFVGWMVKLGGGVPASKRAALEHLRKGGLLIVAPGGVAEAMTPTKSDYKLLWDRSGFAEVARQVSAPIYPMFTQNIREVFLVLFGENSWIKWLYDKTKLPFTPWVGPFLVPLTTIIGKPVIVESYLSRNEISLKARQALQELMTAHAIK